MASCMIFACPFPLPAPPLSLLAKARWLSEGQPTSSATAATASKVRRAALSLFHLTGDGSANRRLMWLVETREEGWTVRARGERNKKWQL